MALPFFVIDTFFYLLHQISLGHENTKKYFLGQLNLGILETQLQHEYTPMEKFKIIFYCLCSYSCLQQPMKIINAIFSLAG